MTYFEDVGSECYKWAIGLPVSVLSLDFTRGDSISLLKEHGFPDDKVTNVGRNRYTKRLSFSTNSIKRYRILVGIFLV